MITPRLVAFVVGCVAAAVVAPLAAVSSAADIEPARAYVIVLDDAVTDVSATAAQQGRRAGFTRRDVYSSAIKGYSAALTPEQVRTVEADPLVQFVTPDRTFAHLDTPPSRPRCEDVLGGIQCLPDWVDRIDAELSSSRSGDGRGSVPATVAIIDSGVDGNHADLNVAGGVDCWTGTAVTASEPTDENGHGTFVAGVVGAKDNRIGIVGAAPGAAIWSAKVDDPVGDISLSAVVCAIDWVTSTRLDKDRRNDILVANISLGDSEGPGDDGACGRTNDDLIHLAICKSVRVGVTYVVAAMNDATDFSATIPASYSEVLTVTAVADYDGKPGGHDTADCYGADYSEYGGADDTPAAFSDYATSPSDKAHTIAAPGVCMESTFPPFPGYYGYAIWDGTSFASPAVTGTVALCIAAGPCRGLTPQRIITKVLERTATYNLQHPRFGFVGDPLRPQGNQYYGYLVRTGLF